jgi:hypothetical protein
VASRGRPIIELAAAFAALVNTPPAKTHEVVNRPVSRHAINCVGAAYRADVSSGRNSHNTASEVTRRGGHSTLIFNQKLSADCGDRITRERWCFHRGLAATRCAGKPDSPGTRRLGVYRKAQVQANTAYHAYHACGAVLASIPTRPSWRYSPTSITEPHGNARRGKRRSERRGNDA